MTLQALMSKAFFLDACQFNPVCFGHGRILMSGVFAGTDPHVTAAESLFIMSSGVIVGIVVASLFILLLLIDFFCFCVNRAGEL